MVPEEWTISTLPNVIGINGIITDGDWIESKDQDLNGDVRLIQLADIGDGRFINKSSRYLTSQKAKDLKCTYLHPGDILIARMPEPLGRACIFPGVEKPSISVVDVCIIHIGKNVDRVWLTATINSQHFRGEIVSRSSGTTRTRISRKNLAQIKILLPQFEEQQKIAAILSSVDDAIQATQAVIDQTRTVKQGLMQQLLTRGIGHTRFKQTEIGEIPEEWCIKTAKEVCSKISVGIVVKPTQYYESNGIKCFRSANVREGYIKDQDWVYISEEANNLNAKSKLQSADVLIVRTGYPGTSCVVPQEYEGTNCIDILFARPKVEIILSHYLSCFINSSLGKKQVLYGQGGLAQKHFNVNALNQMKIVLPSIYEQKKITSILTNIDNVLNIELDKMVQIQKIKRGLMQDLLTGRVRVKLDGYAAT